MSDLIYDYSKGAANHRLRLADEENAKLRANNARLQERVKQFDRAISRIGKAADVACGGVDTEADHGPGGHSAAAIVAELDKRRGERERLTKALEAAHARFAHICEYWNKDSNNAAMFDALTHIEQEAFDGLTAIDNTLKCKTCNGEGGHEAAASSSSYFWKPCPDCSGGAKGRQKTFTHIRQTHYTNIRKDEQE